MVTGRDPAAVHRKHYRTLPRCRGGCCTAGDDARQVGRPAQRRLALQLCWRVEHDDIFIDEQRRLGVGPVAQAIAHARAYGISPKIHQALVDRDIDQDVAMALLETVQARHQPAHREGRQHADRQLAAAVHMSHRAGGRGDTRQRFLDVRMIYAP